MKKTFVMLSIPLALVGCSSVKYNTGVEFTAPTFAESRHKDEVDYPYWYTTTDQKSDKLYGVASEYSKDFQFSVDKAMLSAKRELASQYSSYVSSMMKSFSSEIGEDGAVSQDVDRTTKLIVAQVNLVGVKRDNFEVRKEKDGYRTYVRLSYETSAANKVLVDKIRQDKRLQNKLSKSESFKELESSVDKINSSSPVITQIEPTAPVVTQ